MDYLKRFLQEDSEEEFDCKNCTYCCIESVSCGTEEECSEKYALTLVVAISLVFAGLLLFVYFQTRGSNECCDLECLRRTFKAKKKAEQLESENQESGGHDSRDHDSITLNGRGEIH